jgi:hypothetical protein
MQRGVRFIVNRNKKGKNVQPRWRGLEIRWGRVLIE